jgi:hypothetical protein
MPVDRLPPIGFELAWQDGIAKGIGIDSRDLDDLFKD